MNDKDTRDYLKTNTEIKLRSVRTNSGSETFKIRSVVGNGGSTICYRVNRGGEKGLLKEFYPVGAGVNFNNLKRAANHQLLAVGDAYGQRFKEMCDDFMASFNLLKEVDFSKDSTLNNYIPAFEIFKGTEENSTVYIWCKEQKGTIFSEYISSVWEKPQKNSMFHLYNMLRIVRTISASVLAMHRNNLIHRDIKPDNFLVLKDGMGHINPENVSVFDINSFSRLSGRKYVIGTAGYMAPEVDSGDASYLSDIFSIGATLFNAVCGKVYEKDLYFQIESLVEESPLLSTDDIYLKARIIRILTNALAYSPEMRYERIKYLIEDLDKAIVRLLPYTQSKNLDSNQKLKIIEKNKPIDSIPVFQDLLYQKPVYEKFPEDSDEINLLVIGGGLYAQAFMDVALSTLQMKGKTLNVTVVSDEVDFDKSIYLKNRPDLTRFFDVDKKAGQKDETSYGNINFRQESFKTNGKNDELVNSIVNDTNPCYILVSLGDDDTNHSIAREFAKKAPEALVNFVWTENAKRFVGINPVYINQKIKYSDIDSTLNTMAFNTHIVWNDSLNRDYDELYNEFRILYNYKSSMAYALSIPYKLHSLNLTLKDVENDLSKAVLNPDNDEHKRNINELTYIEHRRWVTEKICDGWTAPVDENGKIKTEICLKFNANKNQDEKIHLCIAKGTLDDCPPESEWDKCDLDKLDELDRVSVSLYRHYKEKAAEFKKDYALNGNKQLLNIKNELIKSNMDIAKLFIEYEMAVDAIIKEGNRSYAGGFNSIHKKMTGAIGNSGIAKKEEFKNTLEALDRNIKPLIYSIKKSNYKSFDEDLVRGIPFIVGHNPRPKMAMVFNDGRYNGFTNEELFKNVASATVIVPRSIKYFYYYTNQTNLKKLLEAINGVIKYFDRKSMKNTVEFVFAFDGEVNTQLESELRNLKSERIGKNKFYGNVGIEEATGKFLNECSSDYIIDGSTTPFSTALDNAHYTGTAYERVYFEFNSREKTFENVNNCEYVKYIDTSNAKMMVEDMFVFKKAECEIAIPDLLGFYRDLWNIYTKGAGGIDAKRVWNNSVNNWNSLTGKLGEYSKTNDIVQSFKLDTNNTAKIIKLTKIIPIACYDTVCYLTEELKKHNFLTDAEISICNYDSIKINISYYEVYDKGMNELFSKYDELQKKLTVSVYYVYNTKKLEIRKNNLTVDSIELSNFEHMCLKKLYNAKLVNDLDAKKPDNSDMYIASFAYPSNSIKSVLTVAGNILELHTYYQLLRHGYFDDVKTNVVVNAEGFQNEFDLILTKDFRSVFIECKAVKGLDQGFYYKIRSLETHYGINSTSVIVSNEHSNSAQEGAVNEANKARGDAMGIITVSEQNNIRNIADAIEKVYKEEF